ncbi:MAG: hypothetical protein VX589_15020 [Myxococcota bacterium]|nr:hypothetical protein [Myxococcota bacterium]
MDAYSLTLGPAQIDAIRFALNELLPWLLESKFRILNNGELEFTDEAPLTAIHALRESVDSVMPDAVTEHLGTRSGLGWPTFFSHVVAWWLPQRKYMGFLRALIDRAALHHVELKLHWNQGRTFRPMILHPGREALLWGTALGVCLAIAAGRMFRIDPVLSLLLVAAGGVGGRIFQRVIRYRVCGDTLCRAPLGRRPICSSCGAGHRDE